MPPSRRDIGKRFTIAGLLVPAAGVAVAKSTLGQQAGDIQHETSVSIPLMANRSQAEKTRFAARLIYLRTASFAELGDGGGGLFYRVSSEPSHPAKLRSADRFLPDGSPSEADGGWWEYSRVGASTEVGVFGTGPTALKEAVAFISEQGGGGVVDTSGRRLGYQLDETLHLKEQIHLDGGAVALEVISDWITGPVIEASGWTGGGGSLRSLRLRGPANFNGNDVGVQIGSSLSASVVDATFEKLRIENYSLGIACSFTWDVSFRNVRVQNCAQPLRLGSQANAITFDTCQFVSFKRTIEVTNAEGVLFLTADISNFEAGKGVPAISLFQSNLTFVNPYFENVGDVSIRVGGTNEVISSQLTLIGGVVDGLIELGANRVSVLIEGSRWLRSGGSVIKQPFAAAPTVYSTNLHVHLDGDQAARKSLAIAAYEYNRTTALITMFGDEALAFEVGREFTIIDTSAATNKGWRIASGLSVGEQYTFVYAIRRSPNLLVGTVNDGSLPATDAFADANEPWELRYMPFIAADQNFGLSFDGRIEFKLVRLYPGVRSSVLQLSGPDRWFAAQPPATGGWRSGDMVYNDFSKTADVVAWVYTGAAWSKFGSLI